MENNVNLSELFNYYRFVLKYENIFQLKYDETYFTKINHFDFRKSIRSEIDAAKLKKQRLNYNSLSVVKQFKHSITKPIALSSDDNNLQENINKFVEDILFLEKTKNFLASAANKNLTIDTNVENSEHFSLKKSNIATFDFALFISLVGVANKKNFDYIPFLVVSFNNKDKDNNPLGMDEILEQIKKELHLEYDHSIDSIPLQPPLLTLNPKMLDKYQLNQLLDDDLSISDYRDWFNIFEKIKSKTQLKDELFKPELYISAYGTSLTASLIKIYDQVLQGKSNDLLKHYFSVHKNKLSQIQTASINDNEIINSEVQLSSYSKHIGSFNCKHSLAETQRVAFTTYLNDQFPILPVNGAPGTGKTALLRGVFGQYIVESGLDAYDHYGKTGEVKFKTPLICSSTNNLALVNVSKGIEDAFQETLAENENNLLYKRWLNCTINTTGEKNNEDTSAVDDNDLEALELEVDNLAFNKNVDLHLQLFVPSLKTRQNSTNKASYFIMTPAMINASILECASHPEKYLENFKLYKPNYLSIHDSVVDQLGKSADYFYQQIKRNINNIQKHDKQSDEIIHNLAEFEKELLHKYIGYGKHLSEVQNSFNEISSQQEHWINWVTRLDSMNKAICDITNQITNIKPSLNSIVSVLHPLFESNCQEDYALSVINNISDGDIKKLNLYKKIYEIIYEDKHKNFITEEELKFQEIQNGLLLDAGFFSKIWFKWFNSGRLARDLQAAKDRKEQLIQNSLGDILLSCEKFSLAKARLELESIKSQLKQFIDEINGYNEQLSQLNEEIGAHNNDLSKLLVFSSDEVQRFISFYDAINLRNKIYNDKKLFDIEERTDNFYYALHLLEALFFLDQVSLAGKNCCPNCNTNNLVKNNGGFACKKCTAFLSKKHQEEFNLTDSQVVQLLKAGYISQGQKYLVIAINKTSTNIWINIKYGYPPTTQINYNKILPIFPMLTLTCNSFGNFITDQDKKIRNDVFDFLLIDEAGTIPPSKMIILYGAKKCMLFGDVKQLKPIYSFSSDTELKILPLFIKDAFHVNAVNQYYSCADSHENKGNNAMSIANNSCQIVLPYNFSKLDGDIWLKEHFRCKDNVVAIANELTYENEIICMQKKNGYLYFIESVGFREDNANIHEAKLILDLILNNTYELKELLESPEISDDDLYKSIGVITPFSNQEMALTNLIDDSCLKDKTTVGTVHKFQGSERRIIIFSTVYSDGEAEQMFFNRVDTSMINVAVTRAKDIFICVGRRKLLKKTSTNSGIMIKHIEQFESLINNHKNVLTLATV
ncbi:MAG: hypothetical protein K2Y14_03855 [Burkholderiales bacterium]|nr:hypothetical protein [Burkholderiales bacterium]